MKVYHCIGKRYSSFILDAYGQFHTTLKQFQQAYGLEGLHSPNGTKDTLEYLDRLTDSRLSIFKDKTRLQLRCNPMTDDLALVFSEWISKQPGFRAVSGPELLEGVTIEEYEFPF